MTTLAPGSDFSTRIISWQKQHGRHDLPWQNTRDAYRIWLSEIMLQQTQVSTVIPYYQRFLTRYPQVTDLANAPLEAVLALWAGLGYYARARNLHRCAQLVAERYQGSFPTKATQLATLPGIGRSTAAAIAAFSVGERAAILDGNVKRVLCRHFAIEGDPGRKAIENNLWELAGQLLPAEDMPIYTQGIMDLGATLCTRSQPRCDACPLANACQAKAQGRQTSLPTPKARKALPERETAFLIISDGEHVLLQRRPARGIWGGLLVPPEAESRAELEQVLELALGLDSRGTAPQPGTPMPALRHSFTHFRLTLWPHLHRLPAAIVPRLSKGMYWLKWDEALEAGLPTPIKQLLLTARPLASSPDSAPSDQSFRR